LVERHRAEYGLNRCLRALSVSKSARHRHRRPKVTGWAVGKSANRKLALRCWEMAKASLAAWSLGPRGLIEHHDQDSVYASYRWLRQLLLVDKAVVSYCKGGAKYNPWMESFWAHFRRERVLVPGGGHLRRAGVGDRKADGVLQQRASALAAGIPVGHGVSYK